MKARFSLMVRSSSARRSASRRMPHHARTCALVLDLTPCMRASPQVSTASRYLATKFRMSVKYSSWLAGSAASHPDESPPLFVESIVSVLLVAMFALGASPA
jgi:hypothetical protein